MNSFILTSFVMLLGIVVLALGQFRHFAASKGLIDIPNHRSSHKQSTPRAGGVVFMSAWIIWMVYAYVSHHISFELFFAFTPSVLILAVVGLIDDRYTLSAKWRLGAQAISTAIFLAQLGQLAHIHLGPAHFTIGVFGTIFAALALLWSTNLFNFMDGTDGIASVEAITVLGVGGFILYTHGAHELGIIAWSLCVAVAGFLRWNWPPAKIFMGDVGSTCLGFLIIAIALIGQKKYDISLTPWIILYMMFLFDATATLIRRILRREKWYEAHKQHAYQRLHQAGFSHTQVLYFVIAFNMGLVALALIATHVRHHELHALIAALAITSLSYYFVEQMVSTIRRETS